MREGVSIILCTFNGKDRLGPSLNAIQNIDPEVPKELILVDNASIDGTGDWLKEYVETSKLRFPVRYLYEPKPGLIHARVAGIQSAVFDFILFCDDDNALALDYLSVGIRLFKANAELGVLGGFGIPVLEGPEPNWLSRYRKSFALGPQAAHSGKIQELPGHVYGAAFFFRKKPLIELIDSGYQFYLTGRTQTQTVSGDDLELCWLMQLMGYEIHYSEDLKFFHSMPINRMSTDYLIKMKSGTAAGSALLYAYRYFFRFPDSGIFNFSFAYFFQALKSGLIYLKNKLVDPKGLISWEKTLAVSILASQWNSFFTQFSKAKSIFSQLQSRKEVWNLKP